MSTAVHQQSRHPDNTPRVGRFRLWYGLAAGPLAWSVQEVFCYYLSSLNCQPGNLGDTIAGYGTFQWLIALVSLVLALATVAALLLSFSDWQSTGAGTAQTEAGRATRLSFMTGAGIIVNVFFLALIILSAIPNFVLPPCAHS